MKLGESKGSAYKLGGLGRGWWRQELVTRCSLSSPPQSFVPVRARARRPKQGIELALALTHTLDMSTKQIVQDLLERLPDEVSLQDVAREIDFIAAVRQGLAEIDRGERVPIEEIERELPSWVIK